MSSVDEISARYHQKWREVDSLIRAAEDNRWAIFDLARRLHQRFDLQMVYPEDGRPHALSNMPVNSGTQPPYWMVLRYGSDAAAKRGTPHEVMLEVKALISQGDRIRNQLLGYYPDLDKNLLFPLNLRLRDGE